MGLYERTPTPLTMGSALPLMREVFLEKTGQEMGAAEPYLLSIFALENGRGKDVTNHNWGNVITWNDEQDYYIKGKNPRKFRNLPNHRAGAEYWINTLLTPTNKRIVEAALQGDFEGFFSGIHDLHPATKKAYNYLPDSGYERAPARKAYRSLVSEFSQNPIDPTHITTPKTPIPMGKKASKKKSSGGAGVLLLLLVAAIGTIYAKKTQPQLRKFFK